MRKNIAFLLVAALTAAILAGCSNSSSSSASTTAAAATTTAETQASETKDVATTAAAETAKSDYPSEDIKIIVPYAAGGNTDLIARKMAELLPKYLPNNCSMYVENISEGGNVPGTTQVYNAAPDGYTLGVFGQGPMSTTPLTVKTPYSHDSFTVVAQIASFAPSIAVAADSEFETFDQLLEAIKANPGKYSYASQSLAGAGNCAMQPLIKAEGLDLVYIPSGGDAKSVTELLGGHVDFIVGGPYKSYIDFGELRVLATLGETGASYCEDGSYVNISELGYETLGDSYTAIVAPAGLDPEVLQILEDGVEQLMKDEEFTSLLESFGLNLEYKNSKETQEVVSNLYHKTHDVFKEIGVDMVVD